MREVAMLVTERNVPLITAFGHEVGVDFPLDFALEVHKLYPGIIRKMVHTHPQGATFMSEEDRTTLKAWTIAFAPYPIKMEVICKRNDGEIYRHNWWYEYEPLSSWLKGDRKNPRIMRLVDAKGFNGKVKYLQTILDLTYGEDK